MLAGLEGCNRHLGMKLIGRGDGDHVDLGVGDQRPPVGRRLLETEFTGTSLSKLGIGFGQMHKTRTLDIAEHRLYRIPRQRMALAHITGADQTDAEWLHFRLLQSCARIFGIFGSF